MIAGPSRVVEAVRHLLDGVDGIEGAFVYGSVARGTAHRGSDIDLFVVTVAALAPPARTCLHSAAEQLQRVLGYRPDPVHVVEIFPAARCADALTGPLVLRATHMAAGGRAVDRITLDSDDLEILRALQDQRLVARSSPVVDGLTALARHQVTTAAHRLGASDQQVLAGIGLPSHDITPLPGRPSEEMS